MIGAPHSNGLLQCQSIYPDPGASASSGVPGRAIPLYDYPSENRGNQELLAGYLTIDQPTDDLRSWLSCMQNEMSLHDLNFDWRGDIWYGRQVLEGWM